ncbi:MAG: hypothetical protein JXB50_14895 [Spirochaetes bacterium]|nr:hypothetical protein [Spirochaetota bacterium]
MVGDFLKDKMKTISNISKKGLNPSLSIAFIFFLFLIVITCQTMKNTQEIIQLKQGLNFEIPEDMYDSTRDAKRFRYNNFLIDINKHYIDSNIVIAVRETINFNNYSLKSFVETDQAKLRQHYNVEYLNEWKPDRLIEKKIEFISFQFSYNYSTDIIYQRSIYIKYKNIFYVVSLSSKSFKNLLSNKSNLFWDSIYLVY